VVDWEYFCDEKFNMLAAKLEVVSHLEIDNAAEKFSEVSPALMDIHVAGIIAEHLIHNGTCGTQNGG
jgi:hypothetical protein